MDRLLPSSIRSFNLTGGGVGRPAPVEIRGPGKVEGRERPTGGFRQFADEAWTGAARLKNEAAAQKTRLVEKFTAIQAGLSLIHGLLLDYVVENSRGTLHALRPNNTVKKEEYCAR